eukprot:gene14485-20509_t
MAAAVLSNTLGVEEKLVRPLLAASIIILNAWVLGLMKSSLTGYINQAVRDFESGEQPMYESGHVVVIGWSNKLFPLLQELCADKKSTSHSGNALLCSDIYDKNCTTGSNLTLNPGAQQIVILAEVDNGNALLRSDLSLVAVETASSVIVLDTDDGSEESDARLLAVTLKLMSIRAEEKQLARLGQRWRRSKTSPAAGGLKGTIITEGCSWNHANTARQLTHAAGIEEDKVRVILSRELLSRLMIQPLSYEPHFICIWSMEYDEVRVILPKELISCLMIQCAKSPYMTSVIMGLISSKGNTFHIPQRSPSSSSKSVLGCSFGSLQSFYPNAVPLGVKSSLHGTTVLSPSMDYTMQEGDSVVLLAGNSKHHLQPVGVRQQESLLQQLRTHAGGKGKKLLPFPESRLRRLSHETASEGRASRSSHETASEGRASRSSHETPSAGRASGSSHETALEGRLRRLSHETASEGRLRRLSHETASAGRASRSSHETGSNPATALFPAIYLPRSPHATSSNVLVPPRTAERTACSPVPVAITHPQISVPSVSKGTVAAAAPSPGPAPQPPSDTACEKMLGSVPPKPESGLTAALRSIPQSRATSSFRLPKMGSVDGWIAGNQPGDEQRSGSIEAALPGSKSMPVSRQAGNVVLGSSGKTMPSRTQQSSSPRTNFSPQSRQEVNLALGSSGKAMSAKLSPQDSSGKAMSAKLSPQDSSGKAMSAKLSPQDSSGKAMSAKLSPQGSSGKAKSSRIQQSSAPKAVDYPVSISRRSSLKVTQSQPHPASGDVDPVVISRRSSLKVTLAHPHQDDQIVDNPVSTPRCGSLQETHGQPHQGSGYVYNPVSTPRCSSLQETHGQPHQGSGYVYNPVSTPRCSSLQETHGQPHQGSGYVYNPVLTPRCSSLKVTLAQPCQDEEVNDYPVVATRRTSPMPPKPSQPHKDTENVDNPVSIHRRSSLKVTLAKLQQDDEDVEYPIVTTRRSALKVTEGPSRQDDDGVGTVPKGTKAISQQGADGRESVQSSAYSASCKPPVSAIHYMPSASQEPSVSAIHNMPSAFREPCASTIHCAPSASRERSTGTIHYAPSASASSVAAAAALASPGSLTPEHSADVIHSHVALASRDELTPEHSAGINRSHTLADSALGNFDDIRSHVALACPGGPAPEHSSGILHSHALVDSALGSSNNIRSHVALACPGEPPPEHSSGILHSHALVDSALGSSNNIRSHVALACPGEPPPEHSSGILHSHTLVDSALGSSNNIRSHVALACPGEPPPEHSSGILHSHTLVDSALGSSNNIRSHVALACPGEPPPEHSSGILHSHALVDSACGSSQGSDSLAEPAEAKAQQSDEVNTKTAPGPIELDSESSLEDYPVVQPYKRMPTASYPYREEEVREAISGYSSSSIREVSLRLEPVVIPPSLSSSQVSTLNISSSQPHAYAVPDSESGALTVDQSPKPLDKLSAGSGSGSASVSSLAKRVYLNLKKELASSDRPTHQYVHGIFPASSSLKRRPSDVPPGTSTNPAGAPPATSTKPADMPPATSTKSTVVPTSNGTKPARAPPATSKNPEDVPSATSTNLADVPTATNTKPASVPPGVIHPTKAKPGAFDKTRVPEANRRGQDKPDAQVNASTPKASPPSQDNPGAIVDARAVSDSDVKLPITLASSASPRSQDDPRTSMDAGAVSDSDVQLPRTLASSANHPSWHDPWLQAESGVVSDSETQLPSILTSSTQNPRQDELEVQVDPEEAHVPATLVGDSEQGHPKLMGEESFYREIETFFANKQDTDQTAPDPKSKDNDADESAQPDKIVRPGEDSSNKGDDGGVYPVVLPCTPEEMSPVLRSTPSPTSRKDADANVSEEDEEGDDYPVVTPYTREASMDNPYTPEEVAVAMGSTPSSMSRKDAVSNESEEGEEGDDYPVVMPYTREASLDNPYTPEEVAVALGSATSSLSRKDTLSNASSFKSSNTRRKMVAAVDSFASSLTSQEAAAALRALECMPNKVSINPNVEVIAPQDSHNRAEEEESVASTVQDGCSDSDTSLATFLDRISLQPLAGEEADEEDEVASPIAAKVINHKPSRFGFTPVDSFRLTRQRKTQTQAQTQTQIQTQKPSKALQGHLTGSAGVSRFSLNPVDSFQLARRKQTQASSPSTPKSVGGSQVGGQRTGIADGMKKTAVDSFPLNLQKGGQRKSVAGGMKLTPVDSFRLNQRKLDHTQGITSAETARTSTALASRRVAKVRARADEEMDSGADSPTASSPVPYFGHLDFGPCDSFELAKNKMQRNKANSSAPVRKADVCRSLTIKIPIYGLSNPAHQHIKFAPADSFRLNPDKIEHSKTMGGAHDEEEDVSTIPTGLSNPAHQHIKFTPSDSFRLNAKKMHRSKTNYALYRAEEGGSKIPTGLSNPDHQHIKFAPSDSFRLNAKKMHRSKTTYALYRAEEGGSKIPTGLSNPDHQYIKFAPSDSFRLNADKIERSRAILEGAEGDSKIPTGTEDAMTTLMTTQTDAEMPNMPATRKAPMTTHAASETQSTATACQAPPQGPARMLHRQITEFTSGMSAQKSSLFLILVELLRSVASYMGMTVSADAAVKQRQSSFTGAAATTVAAHHASAAEGAKCFAGEVPWWERISAETFLKPASATSALALSSTLALAMSSTSANSSHPHAADSVEIEAVMSELVECGVSPVSTPGAHMVPSTPNLDKETGHGLVSNTVTTPGGAAAAVLSSNSTKAIKPVTTLGGAAAAAVQISNTTRVSNPVTTPGGAAAAGQSSSSTKEFMLSGPMPTLAETAAKAAITRGAKAAVTRGAKEPPASEATLQLLEVDSSTAKSAITVKWNEATSSDGSSLSRARSTQVKPTVKWDEATISAGPSLSRARSTQVKPTVKWNEATSSDGSSLSRARSTQVKPTVKWDEATISAGPSLALVH